VRRPLLRVMVACGTLWVVPCGAAPELPRISDPPPTLDADDDAVMRATLDYLRPLRDDSIRRGRSSHAPPRVIEARFLVVDATAPACAGPVPSPQLPGCVGDSWLRHFPATKRSTNAALEIFRRRNARSFPIRGDLGTDVVLVPVLDSNADLASLVRSHPPGSTIVCFSAPAYVDGAAVIAYRTLWDSGGFVRVERYGNGWKGVARNAWIE
jgi:hypothetical protein